MSSPIHKIFIPPIKMLDCDREKTKIAHSPRCQIKRNDFTRNNQLSSANIFLSRFPLRPRSTPRIAVRTLVSTRRTGQESTAAEGAPFLLPPPVVCRHWSEEPHGEEGGANGHARGRVDVECVDGMARENRACVCNTCSVFRDSILNDYLAPQNRKEHIMC